MRDPYGLIPPDIKARYEREEFVDRSVNKVRGFADALKSLSPDLELVFIRGDIAESELPVNGVRGRWHVRKNNPVPMLPSYIPILGPNGSYREPDSGVFQELANGDLRRPEVMRETLEKTRTDNGRADKQTKTEQRQDEMAADFRAAKRVAGEGGLKKKLWAKGKVAA